MSADRTCYAAFAADGDGDRMPDDWERLHGLNPALDDAGGDLDSDGVTNLKEYHDGTDPDDPESFRRPIMAPVINLLLD